MIGVADPSIFAEDGGPSIASRMTRAARIIFRPGDNKRVPQRGAMGGWDQVRARLVGDADGKPMVVLFATCRAHLITDFTGAATRCEPRRRYRHRNGGPLRGRDEVCADEQTVYSRCGTSEATRLVGRRVQPGRGTVARLEGDMSDDKIRSGDAGRDRFCA